MKTRTSHVVLSLCGQTKVFVIYMYLSLTFLSFRRHLDIFVDYTLPLQLKLDFLPWPGGSAG